jgi:hypothetical protein
MTGDALLKGGKPANAQRMTNPASHAGDPLDDRLEQTLPVVMQRTGTDPFSVVDDQTAGVTVASRTKDTRITAMPGNMRPSTLKERVTGKSPSQPRGESAVTPAARQPAPTPVNDNERGIAGPSRLLPGARPGTTVTPPVHPVYANQNATVQERLRFLENENLRLIQQRAGVGLKQSQLVKLREWRAGLDRGEIAPEQILQRRGRGIISVRSMEDTLDMALTEVFRRDLEVATGMPIVSIARSSNVGDRAADLHAQFEGRRRAYPFTTTTAAGELVQFDDYDFEARQPIESKSVADLAPLGKPEDLNLKDLRQQMEKQAIAVRDHKAVQVRWNVPPDAVEKLIDDVWGFLPRDLRRYVYVPKQPAPPIR